jgi:DNA-binding transcriptional LysR family regulator
VSEVDLEATNSDTVVRRLLDGTADVGFVEGPRPPKSVRSRVIGHDELLVVVQPAHAWARRRKGLSVEELASTPLVSREVGSGTRQAFEAAVLAALPRASEPGGHASFARPTLELSNAAAVRAAVVAGAGPAVMSSLAAADDLALGRLCVVKVPLDLRRSLRAVWLGPAQPPAGAVRDLIGIAAQGQ